MHRLRNHTSLSLLCLVASLGLAGCSGFGGSPDVVIAPASATTPIGSISGSNYGGHAPLAGSHIYLVEPGNTGYGSTAKSLLTASGGTVSNGSWPATAIGDTSDQFIPVGTYGLLADSQGAFSLTGDYTCDAGRPVYVIGYGGSPSYPMNQPSILMATSASTSYTLDSAVSDGTHAIYTYTTASTENFYIGEGVVVSNFANGSSALNQTGTVADPGNSAQYVTYNGTTYKPTLSTTQFSIYNTTTLAAGAGYGVFSQSGVSPAPAVQASPSFNPAAVNVATLGICPSSGTLANQIRYIYMNEVSTVAFAYAFNQFANWSGTEQGAGSAGNNALNIGAPATAMAQQALVNAAYAAGNLYDIQGSNLSTTYAGEGHIARSQTPSGAGIVPQAELNTLANILAACVDSNNTYRHTNGVISNQCKTLLQYAPDNGAYDTTSSAHQAFNNVQAALNIAHYPQGNGTATTSGGVQTITAGNATTASNFVSALFNLPTGNVPFTPNLTTAPNDFSVGINWQTSPYAQSGTMPSNPSNNSTTNTGSTTNQVSVGEVAIDSLGNAFIVANQSGSGSPATNANGVFELSPAGYYTFIPTLPYAATATVNSAGLAIDRSNNLYVNATAGVEFYNASKGYASQNGGDCNSNLIGYPGCSGPLTRNGGEIAVDNQASPSIYVANLNDNNPPGTTTATAFGSASSSLVKEPAVLGNATTTFSYGPGGGSATANSVAACGQYLNYVTLDGSDNIWTSNSSYENGGNRGPVDQVCKFSNTGTLLFSYTDFASTHSMNTKMIAVDKAGNGWYADYQDDYLGFIPYNAAAAAGTNGSGSITNFAYSNTVLSGPWGVAVDGANTLWVADHFNSSKVVHIADNGALLNPTFYQGTTGAGGFNSVTGSGTTTPTLSFEVIDMSGNIWTSDAPHGEVIEWIGMAAPTVQPLAQQRYGTANNTGYGIGQMP